MTDTPTPERVSDERLRRIIEREQQERGTTVLCMLAAECLASRAATGAPAVEAASIAMRTDVLRSVINHELTQFFGNVLDNYNINAITRNITALASAAIAAAVAAARQEEREACAKIADKQAVYYSQIVGGPDGVPAYIALAIRSRT